MKIQKGIPVVRHDTRSSMYPFSQMVHGDSLKLTPKQAGVYARRVYNVFNLYRIRSGSKLRLRVKKLNSQGAYRVWTIDPRKEAAGK